MVAMEAQPVARIPNLFGNGRGPIDPTAQPKKASGHLFLIQQAQQVWRIFRVGPVVKAESNFPAIGIAGPQTQGKAGRQDWIEAWIEPSKLHC